MVTVALEVTPPSSDIIPVEVPHLASFQWQCLLTPVKVPQLASFQSIFWTINLLGCQTSWRSSSVEFTSCQPCTSNGLDSCQHFNGQKRVSLHDIAT